MVNGTGSAQASSQLDFAFSPLPYRMGIEPVVGRNFQTMEGAIIRGPRELRVAL